MATNGARGIRPLSPDRYSLFLQLLKGTFKVPVKERTAQQRKQLLHFWRVNDHLSLDVENGADIMRHDGKNVISTSEFKGEVVKEAKKTMGAGARSVYHIIKSKTIVGSERTVRKILGKRVDHSFANARFTNQAPITPIVAKKVFERVQIDLVDMRKDRVLYNGVRYSFILSVVDCFSRFTFLRHLPSKRSSGILHCLKNIFHEHGYHQ